MALGPVRRIVTDAVTPPVGLSDAGSVRVETLKNWVRHRSRPGYMNPFSLVPVDPAALDWVWVQESSGGLIEDRDGFGQVKRGDWTVSDRVRPITTHHTVKGIEERFVDGYSWEDTSYYDTVTYNMERGNSFTWYDSVEDFVETRLAYVDELYRDIRENGYRANVHDVDGENTALRSHYRDAFEVMVVIGADGELILYDGKHRAALARIIDSVETIPVHVVCRHERWQETLDEIATHGEGSVPPDIVDHPDVTRILERET